MKLQSWRQLARLTNYKSMRIRGGLDCTGYSSAGRGSWPERPDDDLGRHPR